MFLLGVSFGLTATESIAPHNAGAHLQRFIDCICVLRQGLGALHPLLQGAQPAGLKIQIVKQLNPARPYLLERTRQKLHHRRSHFRCAVSPVQHILSNQQQQLHLDRSISENLETDEVGISISEKIKFFNKSY